MVKMIEPQYHHFHQSIIESFLGLLKVYQNVLLSEEEKNNAIFIIAQDTKRGVYGGAVVYKKKFYALHEKIRKILSAFLPHHNEVWTATTCYCVEDEGFCSSIEIVDLNLRFYRDLFEKLKEVGFKKDIKILCLTLAPQEYVKTKCKGFWPYILEVAPESSDGFFQGMLSLQGV